MIRRRARTARTGDRGQASLELLGMIPLLFFAGFLVLQFGVAMWAITSTNEAARQAARAYSLDGAGAARPAAEDSLPGSLKVASISTVGPDHGVRLSVDIPVVLPVKLSLGTVTREVVMP